MYNIKNRIDSMIKIKTKNNKPIFKDILLNIIDLTTTNKLLYPKYQVRDIINKNERDDSIPKKTVI
ncbi:glycoside hydrolase [Oceanobacillus picturae]|uniref:Glycoside hydrolase n=1 Tax=Oceanobacillus picturae TaxID=171693 RepID=A0A0U9HAX8_9BACI|nr:glycoside hydrolase [Oceanobacillus picturae]